MAYSVNRTSNPASGITVADGSINNTFDIALIGKGYTNYGELIQENMLHILENFARPTPPPNPTAGQLHYNTATGVLSIYNASGGWDDLKEPNAQSITNTHIAAGAVIDITKLAKGVGTQIIICDPSGTPVYRNLSGAIEMTSTGVTTLADGSVTAAKLTNGVIQTNHLSASLHIPNLTTDNFTLAANSVSTIELQTDSVGSAQIRQDSVGRSEIAPLTLRTGHFSASIHIAALSASALQVTRKIVIDRQSGDFIEFDNGDSRITGHGFGGDFQFKAGVNEEDFYQTSGHGAGKLTVQYENNHGYVRLSAAEIGLQGNPPQWKHAVFDHEGTFTVHKVDAVNIIAASASFERMQVDAISTIGGFTAQYADLSERYEADDTVKNDDEGLVVIFGGDNEITISTSIMDPRVAGVVSCFPAFEMNATLQTETWPAIALQGRVPVKVLGKVNKGDMLVTSNVPGYAQAFPGGSSESPRVGSVIGKAIQKKDTEERGIVIAVVGRV